MLRFLDGQELIFFRGGHSSVEWLYSEAKNFEKGISFEMPFFHTI